MKRIRRFIIEDLLALSWCRRCMALMWRGHGGIHAAWHAHLDSEVEG